MELHVSTNQYAKQENGKLGVANVSFGEDFKVKSINIHQNKDGELFVVMPSYKTKKVDENERPVFANICNPVTKEFREQMYQAILESYQTGKDVTVNVDTGIDVPKVDVKVTPLEGEGITKGLARVCFDDSFVVNNISIMESKDKTLYLSMPSKPTGTLDENGKPQYRDICYPATKEFREILQEKVLTAYREAREATKEQSPKEKPSVLANVQKKTKSLKSHKKEATIAQPAL